jgi:hypothetical protein
MPEKPTIPTAEILDSVRSLLEEHPELLKIVLLIPGASSVEHLPEQPGSKQNGGFRVSSSKLTRNTFAESSMPLAPET